MKSVFRMTRPRSNAAIRTSRPCGGTRTFAQFCLAVATGVGVMTDAHAQSKVIRIASQFPPDNILVKNLRTFEGCVENRADSIDVQNYPAAQLYKDDQLMPATISGAIEMSNISQAYVGSSVPIINVFYLPFLFNTQEKVNAATSRGSDIRQLIDNAIAETGVRPIFWQTYGSIVFVSNSALREPSDVQGVKVRTFGKYVSYTTEALGGSPVVTSGSEMYLALDQGVANAAMTAISSVSSRRIFEVADYMTVTKHARQFYPVVMNDQFWDGLTDTEKEAVTSCGKEAETQSRNAIRKTEANTVDELRDKMTVIELDDQQTQRWREATSSVVDRFLENTGKRGEKVIELARDLQNTE